MKIIHIVLGKANPNRMNGVNKVAHNLATAQIKLGYDVEIIGLSNTPEVDKISRNYKLNLFKRNKPLLDKQLTNYLKDSFQSDSVFHMHGGFIIDFYLIARLLKKTKHRYIFTSHGAYNKEALKKNFLLKKIFFNFFDRFILKNAWKAQFLGESEYLYIDDLIKNINKVLIPNGQNLDELKHDYLKIESAKRPIFGFVGRIDSHTKGLDILFNGFLAYKKRRGKGILWIIGDGPDKNKLMQFTTKNQIESDVLFFGEKFGNEKLNLIANMDIFVHTSRFEGFPMAVLEAAGLGKPLLVSKGTNFGAYTNEHNCGLVLLEENASSIKDALFSFEKIVATNKITPLSLNSKAMVVDLFGWRLIAKKLVEE